jgi:RHS repeat-associated protein
MQITAPIAMTDESQAVVWKAPFDEWGSERSGTSMIKTVQRVAHTQDDALLNLRLAGQYFDQETGLHDNLNRTYDPKTGKYLQPDPLGYPDGPDAYLYAGGDPLNNTDSLGLYTEYWGGAGLDGPYILDQIVALQENGIENVYRGYGSGGSGLLGTILDANAVINLRTNPPQYGYLTPRAPYAPAPRQRKKICSEQTNYIGYSYGSLLAAHTALHYANRGNVIDNLVLIGSPIDASFLRELQNHPSINFVTVINLTDKGDPIFAGMSEFDLLRGIPSLATDFLTPGKGHFYYAPDSQEGKRRRRELATFLAREGLK